MSIVLHMVQLVARGIPLTIAAEDDKVVLHFRSPEEALKYAADIAEGLRDFAHLWKPSEKFEAGGVVLSRYAVLAPSYVCANCGRESWNKGDIEHRYCGACKSYG